MPVFTDALVGDTLHLSRDQFGAYMLILIATWRNNGQALPDDDRRMAHLTRATVKEWRTRLRPVLVEFFDISDGHWHQKRLEAEWADAIQKSTKQAIRSRGRWKQPPIPFEDAKPLNLEKTGDAAGYPAGMPGACIPAAMPSREATLPPESPSLSDSESLAASAPVDKKHEGYPLSSLRSPCRKSDALKLQIKRQLAVKHCRYLGAQCRWDELAEYHDAMKAGENGLPPRELFDAIDRRMRASGWDDMRWWRELERRPRDLAPDPHSVEAMMIRKGWFHGKAAAAAA